LAQAIHSVVMTGGMRCFISISIKGTFAHF
jgi:hypothetical protein